MLTNCDLNIFVYSFGLARDHIYVWKTSFAKSCFSCVEERAVFCIFNIFLQFLILVISFVRYCHKIIQTKNYNQYPPFCNSLLQFPERFSKLISYSLNISFTFYDWLKTDLTKLQTNKYGKLGFFKSKTVFLAQSVSYFRTLGTMKPEKGKKQRLILKLELGTLAPNGINDDFHSLNFKHIFDQLDATNFSQWQN